MSSSLIQILEEDVPGPVEVPVHLDLAPRASKDFGSSQAVVNESTCPTRLGGVLLGHQNNPAPRVLSGLVK